MKKYLYKLNIWGEGEVDETIQYEDSLYISENNLSENDILHDEDEPYIAFYDMVFKHYLGFNNFEELEIEDKIPCNFTENECLPNNFYNSLLWFNQAVNKYSSSMKIKEAQKIIKDFNELNHILNLENARQITEIDIVYAQAYYKTKLERLEYCQRVIKEIVKLLTPPIIEKYDYIITPYKNERQREEKDISFSDIIDIHEEQQIYPNIDYELLNEWNEKEYKKQQQQQLYDNWNNIDFLRHTILGYLFLLVERLFSLLDNLLFCIQFDEHNKSFDNQLYTSLKCHILQTQQTFLVEEEKLKVSFDKTLFTLDSINNEEVNKTPNEEANRILNEIFSVSNRALGTKMLNKIDQDFQISTNCHFPKRQLGIIIYIMYCSETVHFSLSFEKFKKEICSYYAKENISIKPNKVRQEAIALYNDKIYMFRDYNINTKKLYGKG